MNWGVHVFYIDLNQSKPKHLDFTKTDSLNLLDGYRLLQHPHSQLR